MGNEGVVPPEACETCLSDEETAAAVRFIVMGMVNQFQGFVAEALALKPLARVVAEWKASGALPESCRLFVGDAVRPLAGEGRRARKGADAHVLEIVGSLVRIHAIAEVKSGHVAAERLHAQLIAPGNLP